MCIKASKLRTCFINYKVLSTYRSSSLHCPMARCTIVIRSPKERAIP